MIGHIDYIDRGRPMNLKQAHQFLGDLLSAGVAPEIPVAAICRGWPCEIADAVLLEGSYNGDPAPKLSAFAPRAGVVLALVPIGEDPSDLTHDGAHASSALPVAFP